MTPLGIGCGSCCCLPDAGLPSLWGQTPSVSLRSDVTTFCSGNKGQVATRF